MSTNAHVLCHILADMATGEIEGLHNAHPDNNMLQRVIALRTLNQNNRAPLSDIHGYLQDGQMICQAVIVILDTQNSDDAAWLWRKLEEAVSIVPDVLMVEAMLWTKDDLAAIMAAISANVHNRNWLNEQLADILREIPLGVDIVVQMLQCPICLMRMQAPIFHCENGHLICGGCVERVERCPACRINMGRIRCLPMEGLAEQVQGFVNDDDF